MTTHIDIFIRREGVLDPSHHQVRPGITVAELSIDLHGGEAVGLFLFEEDADEPLHGHHEIHHGHHGPRFLHHSRCRHVHVEVRYAGTPAERSFGPGSTLTRVKDWAEHALGLDAGDAAELSLQVAGTTDRPDGSVHVGSLAKCPDCRVVFDLLAHRQGQRLMTPDRAQLERDLAAAPFQEGAARGRWGLVTIAWPHAFFRIRAKDGREFVLRLDCMGYPAQPPTGGLWDIDAGTVPGEHAWPKGNDVFMATFRRDWQNGTAIYFPLDRVSRQGHAEWTSAHPHLTWRPELGIVQYLAEIHRHLNSRGYHGCA